MNRIAIPTTDQTPAGSLPLLAAVQKQLGVVPNLMKLVGHSPAALEGYLSLNSALGKGSLGPKTAERIALAIAQINGCSYCLSAHSYLGKHVAKLEDAEMAANRDGTSSDPKAAVAVHFATRVALHVALNTLTNYVNEVAQTERLPACSTRPARRRVTYARD